MFASGRLVNCGGLEYRKSGKLAGLYAYTSFSAERRWKMGEPNNALSVYVNRPDRIKSVLEYYLL